MQSEPLLVHRNTQDPDPGRYFGIDDLSQVFVEAEPRPSAPIDAGALLLASLREFEVVYADRTIDGHPYYFAGENPDWWRARTDPWHDVKFAHAVLELLTVLSKEARTESRGWLPSAWGAVEGSWKG